MGQTLIRSPPGCGRIARELAAAVVVSGLFALLAACASHPPSDEAESQPGNKTLKGRIDGLSASGLVLSDSLGNVLRPAATATEFQFRDGEAYLAPGDTYQLLVVRQPLGQKCAVHSVPADEPGEQQVVCETTGSVSWSPQAAHMRDCFRVPLRGAAFSLGRIGPAGPEVLAEVTLDPIGTDRQQHRTFVKGHLALEAITYFPMHASQAQIEWVSLRDPQGVVTSTRQGLSGGMPLDLEVGEERSFNVTVLIQQAGQLSAKPHALRRQIKLLDMGPLTTPGGHFPLACHLQEINAEGDAGSEVWYAPGYGPVKTQGTAPAETLEVLEIQQRPD